MLVVLSLLLALPPRNVEAAGYFSGTRGARAAGRGGAFTVGVDDLSAPLLNPAGLAKIDGLLVQVGNRFSHNGYSFTRDPTLDWGNLVNGVPPYVELPSVHNERPWQLLDPLFGIASNLGLPGWGFGLSANAPPGIGRYAFPAGGGQRYMMVGRDSRIVSYSATVAWRLRDRFGIGVSAQWINVSRLDYSLVIDGNPFPGRAYPVSGDLDMLATTKGSDPFVWNTMVGAWYRPWPHFELAVAGQVIPTEIKTRSVLSVSPLSANVTDEVELLRAGLPANDVSLTLPLPMTARAGIRYIGTRGGIHRYDLELNIGYETWSRVKEFVVESNGLEAVLRGQRIPIGRITVPKLWRDTFSVHLGGDYLVLPGRLTLRGGLFYESAVAPRRTASVDFVGGQQLGGAVGASIFWRSLEVAVSYEHRRQPRFHVSEADGRVYQQVPGSQCQPPYTDPDRCHPQYLGQPAPVVNGGTYAASSNILLLDLLWRF